MKTGLTQTKRNSEDIRWNPVWAIEEVRNWTVLPFGYITELYKNMYIMVNCGCLLDLDRLCSNNFLLLSLDQPLHGLLSQLSFQR